jgi:hypothetical protein
MIMNEKRKFGSARAVSVLELTGLFVRISSDASSAAYIVPNDSGRLL